MTIYSCANLLVIYVPLSLAGQTLSRGKLGSGIVAYTELCWRQDLVASNQIAASFHVINKPFATSRLIIRDMLVHPSLNMAGGLDVFIEEAAASLRYHAEPKRRTEANCKAFVEEMDVRIFIYARAACTSLQSNHCIPLPQLCARDATRPFPSRQRVWLARLPASIYSVQYSRILR